MKLLFDQNLSPRLVIGVRARFPDSAHVSDLGLESASDDAVWQVARSLGMCIVSKDDDFRQLATLRGHPPKVLWLRAGNCSTRQIAAIIAAHADDIDRFGAESGTSVFMLG